MLCAVVMVSSLSAQVQFGAKAGFDYSNMKVSVKGLSASIGTGFRPGFYAGATMNVPFGDSWGLQTELTYNNTGTRVAASKSIVGDLAAGLGDILDQEFELPNESLAISLTNHVLRLPVLLTYNVSQQVSVGFGPYIGYAIGTSMGANDAMSDMLTDEAYDALEKMATNVVKDNINKFEFGLALNAEYKFECGAFIEARYNWNLTNSLKQSIEYNGEPVFDFTGSGVTPRAKFHSLQVGVGYRF